MECTVEDFGTGRVKGDWFLLGYPTGEEEVTATEMKEILANRID